MNEKPSTPIDILNYEEPDQLPKTKLDTPKDYYIDAYYDQAKNFIPEDVSVDEYDKKFTKKEGKKAKLGINGKKESFKG